MMASGMAPNSTSPDASKKSKKNPAAVALGRLGGRARAKSLTKTERKLIARKAGQERANKLSAAERSAIARKAALAKWRKK